MLIKKRVLFLGVLIVFVVGFAGGWFGSNAYSRSTGSASTTNSSLETSGTTTVSNSSTPLSSLPTEAIAPEVLYRQALDLAYNQVAEQLARDVITNQVQPVSSTPLNTLVSKAFAQEIHCDSGSAQQTVETGIRDAVGRELSALGSGLEANCAKVKINGKVSAELRYFKPRPRLPQGAYVVIVDYSLTADRTWYDAHCKVLTSRYQKQALKFYKVSLGSQSVTPITDNEFSNISRRGIGTLLCSIRNLSIDLLYGSTADCPRCRHP